LGRREEREWYVFTLKPEVVDFLLAEKDLGFYLGNELVLFRKFTCCVFGDEECVDEEMVLSLCCADGGFDGGHFVRPVCD